MLPRSHSPVPFQLILLAIALISTPALAADFEFDYQVNTGGGSGFSTGLGGGGGSTNPDFLFRRAETNANLGVSSGNFTASDPVGGNQPQGQLQIDQIIARDQANLASSALQGPDAAQQQQQLQEALRRDQTIAAVGQLYMEIWTRYPNADELNVWTNSILAGGANLDTLRNGLNARRSEVANDAYNSYVQKYGRGPDTDGWNYWINEIISGRKNGNDLQAALDQALADYQRRNETDHVVDGAYVNYVQRDATAEEKSYWTGEILSGRQSYLTLDTALQSWVGGLDGFDPNAVQTVADLPSRDTTVGVFSKSAGADVGVLTIGPAGIRALTLFRDGANFQGGQLVRVGRGIYLYIIP